MTTSHFILSLFIVPIFTKTFICTNRICDFGICTNNQCTDNTYVCTSSATHCYLECANCNNITILSHARDTEVFCGYKNCCNKVSINIEQSESPANYNSLVLTCAHSSSCIDITISCNNEHHLCQCKDFNDIQCNNNVDGDFSLWHADPFIIRKSIKNKLNHTQSNQINQTQFISQISTFESERLTTNAHISNLETINAIDSDMGTLGQRNWTTYVFFALFPALFCILLCFATFVTIKGKMNERIGNKTKKEEKTISSPNAASIMSIISQSPKTPNSSNSQTLENDMPVSNQPQAIQTTDIIYT